MQYFGQSYVPYMQLYKKDGNKVPSIIRELKDNNYYSKILYGIDYYKSENTLKIIGFDQYTDLDNNGDKKGGSISDEFLIDKIIQELDTKNKDKNLFYMVETIQNHMPYTNDKYEKYDLEITTSNLSTEASEVIRTYAQGIYDADKQLGRLYDYIQTYEEPTIIVFFGDHHPYLDEKVNVFENWKYFNTNDELINIYRKYNTQALILANFELKKEDDLNYLSPDMLGTYIINHMDIKISSYYKWLYSIINDMPSSNQLIMQDKDGNLHRISEFDDNMKNLNDLRQNMQYKMFVKKNMKKE